MFVIGNGESRLKVNLGKLPRPHVGCNAIIRDHSVEYLVCVDRKMVKEAIDRNANDYSLVYTRNDWYDSFRAKHIRKVPKLPYLGEERWDEPFQWGSGPYAVLIAAMYAKEKYVNLIGFDLYSKDKHINNVYKDTVNYDSANKRAVDPRYWVHQIGMVFRCFPKIKFTIYQTPDWVLPKEWKYPNVSLDNLNNL